MAKDRPEPKFKVGDLVFYAENGPGDTGTVRGVNTQHGSTKTEHWYRVEWDNGDPMDEYSEGQLSLVR